MMSPSLEQIAPAIAAHPDGGYISTWISTDTGEDVVMARRYDASSNPVGASYQVSTRTLTGGEEYANPTVAVLDNGAHALVWQFYKPGYYTYSAVRFFTADGTPLGHKSNPGEMPLQYSCAERRSLCGFID